MLIWKDSYSVGVEAIDKQHKVLFEIGNDIASAMKSDKDDKYDDIMYMLEELIDYTEYHFSFEEEMLEKNGLPLSDKHLEQHRFFIDKLTEKKSDEIDESQGETLNELFGFVTDWIVTHILSTDKEYQAPLNGKGVF
ncbi:hypothetical protein EAL2_808p06470 (plasmid) [Peptoclostridium acidaminophilum DSM 3953]|uniref:Hemerythrin-like domain-containing protein n=1 Tax=Peptoclostridium acidaminophilum DSM 3953 TaxID=1286171 RepID=W8TBF5_PEPAC|nr:bacteriohemerythrin [Peptoclostridium acidaminophilum]AHM58150.1 hypothetical protein EAL2_808p06470 [Peptoclostridium acidaminophilum DSM 3953]